MKEESTIYDIGLLMEGELAQWLSAYATALGLSVFCFEAKNSRSEAALLRPAAQLFLWQMKEENKLLDWNYQIHSDKAKSFPHQQMKGLGEKELRPKTKSELRRFPLVQLEAIEEEEEGFICWHSQAGMELQAIRCRYLILSKGCPKKYIAQFDLLAQELNGQKEVQQYQTKSKGKKPQRELFLWPKIYSVEDNGKLRDYRFFGRAWNAKEQEQILAGPGLKGKKDVEEAYRLKKWRKGRLFALGPLAHHLPAYFGLTSSLFWEEMGNLLWRIAYIQSNYLAEEPLLQAWEEEQQRDWQKVFSLQKELLAGQASLWSRFKQYWRGAKFWEQRLLARKNTLLPNLLLEDAFSRQTHLWKIKQMGFLLLGLDNNPVDILTPKELALFARLRSQFVGLYSSQLPEQARFASAYKVSDSAKLGAMGSLVVIDPKGSILAVLKSRKKIQAFCKRLEKSYPEPPQKKIELCKEE
ncbi:hypothetical protein PPO43_15190 [Saprospira sp. CCB-QB6]|uniref:hypothetical protein n=1 Tax=Saprospira sp. CCB-QB6 TaxID=3023936 RepID=UPI00234B9139|nr:hypothetical protein [Saprospira sp. CCB-QB6]WCL81319.1 hypothetical protein PPO43_15190 [Saprospira sp. CCB-QB6]